TLGSQDTTLHDLAILREKGHTPVVVHGGGKTISDWLERQGANAQFIRGLRVTDNNSLEVVLAVLAGLINKTLVSSLISLGVKAIGISGIDGSSVEAKIENPELGFVGQVTQVNPELLQSLIESGFTPVVAPVSIRNVNEMTTENKILNINADAVAGEIAVALNAERLIFLTDVEGVLDSSQSLIKTLSADDAQHLITSGTAGGGMIPKLEACIRALSTVSKAYIVDGRQEHALINAIDNNPTGTELR
ncbi:MAG: acetylglutamate kinase, partial [Anaerolineales bacterium]|nr:acetylglutamate kinase [Anaerolineales bacterium]